MASPNTLARAHKYDAIGKHADGSTEWIPAHKVVRQGLSGADWSLLMRAENAAYKRWAHTRNGKPSDRETFKRQPNVTEMVQEAARGIMEAVRAKKEGE